MEYWMSKKPTSYADVLKQKEQTQQPKKFNLFDFSSVKTQQPVQTQQLNFWQPVSQRNVTNFSDYKKTITQVQTKPAQKSGFSLIPTANAMETQPEKYLSKQKVKEIIDNRPEWVQPIDLFTQLEQKGYIIEWYNDKWTQPTKESFIEWVWTKTKESFLWGIKRIWEAGVWLAEWKYTPTEAFLRWWAWALQSATSPIAWVLWETIETWIEKIPQDFKDYISTKTKPTIQDVTTWYNTLDPERKRALDNLWVTAEVLLNFVWAWTAQKATPVVRQWLENTWNLLKRQVDNIIPKTDLNNIDAETISKIRQWVRPSNVWIDTTWKYKMQEEKLLQWVKEVVKEWYTPKNAKEAMDAISNTKQKIWWVKSKT